MQDGTEFGKVLRSLLPGQNLHQGKIAKKLGVSTGTISNYITGKNIPGTDFLSKCIKEFGLKKGAMANFFYTAFLSAATSKQKEVIIDARLIDSERIEILAKFLTVLVLYPHMENPEIKSDHKRDPGKINKLGKEILYFYKVLEEEVEFHPPD